MPGFVIHKKGLCLGCHLVLSRGVLLRHQLFWMCKKRLVEEVFAQVQGGSLGWCVSWGLGIMLLLCLPAWPAVPLRRIEALPVYIYLPVIVKLLVSSTHLPALQHARCWLSLLHLMHCNIHQPSGSCCPERVWNCSAGIAGYVCCCLGFLPMPPLCCCSGMSLRCCRFGLCGAISHLAVFVLPHCVLWCCFVWTSAN